MYELHILGRELLKQRVNVGPRVRTKRNQVDALVSFAQAHAEGLRRTLGGEIDRVALAVGDAQTPVGAEKVGLGLEVLNGEREIAKVGKLANSHQ